MQVFVITFCSSHNLMFLFQFSTPLEKLYVLKLTVMTVSEVQGIYFSTCLVT